MKCPICFDSNEFAIELMKIYHRLKERSAVFANLTKLARSVETALAMFAAHARHQCAKTASIWNKNKLFGSFVQESSREGQLTPLVVGVKLDINALFFRRIFVLFNWSV